MLAAVGIEPSPTLCRRAIDKHHNTLLCRWQRHLTLSSQLAAVQLSGQERKLATTKLATFASISELIKV